MPTFPGNTASDNDEIDVLKFIERIFRFFTANRIIFTAGILAGIFFGLVFYLSPYKKYSATMMVQSTILTNAEQIAIIDSWNDLVKKDETEILGNILHLPAATTSKIDLIEAEEILKLYVEKNSIGFSVKVLVSDTTILEQLQKSILTAMENIDYVKARIDSRKADLNRLIGKGRAEITALDSTKAGIEKLIFSARGSGPAVMVDLSDFNVQMLTLTERILTYEDELRFIAPIKLLQGFVKYKRPVEPKLVKSLVLGAVIGFLFAYFVAFIRSLARKMKHSRSISN